MAYKRKDSPYWWVSLTDASSKKTRRSTGTTDRKEAEALEAKWRLEIYRQKTWEEMPEVSFEEVMLYYLDTRPKNQSKRAIHENELRAKTLLRYYAGKTMNSLAAIDVLSHRNQRAEVVSPATVNRELAQLSSAINFYNLDYESDLPNPVRGRKLKEQEGRLRWITKAESVALVTAARKSQKAPYLADFIILALNTGMRKQEMLGLEWRRVDLQSGLIHLEAEHTKTSKRRAIPINENARSAIMCRLRYRSDHCPHSKWVFNNSEGERINSVTGSFKTACRNAKINNFRIHDMRHTCAAWLVSDGVGMPEVRDLLGHATIAMTERYAHLAPENVRIAVSVLDEKNVS